MTLEQRKLHDLILRLGRAYESSRTNARLNAAEGWGLANTDTPLTCGIERNDERATFEGDREALTWIAECAAVAPNRRYSNALTIHLLANEYRGMVWGDAYINTRLGPR